MLIVRQQISFSPLAGIAHHLFGIGTLNKSNSGIAQVATSGLPRGTTSGVNHASSSVWGNGLTVVPQKSVLTAIVAFNPNANALLFTNRAVEGVNLACAIDERTHVDGPGAVFINRGLINRRCDTRSIVLALKPLSINS
ncbi:hypothetical protein [Corynebacterium sp.]|uniref:hypothetical protein n=1 Tax=Corynebacterium sp. TaxID=1720 RepID=UPI0026DA8C8A|nr:hypothetical protein [Corynebacterium sp.]MDO5032613.1 hypothetical protein [Corynebacterium sp.]